ncbi:hypothetical protein H9654_16140 [Stenotrophomonas sp. Sa5BUN4]|uniref:Uncharacterized protein n=1 Tax=Stenotrophomonas lacuserhaii TaxID=2760084 RepID=A0A8X8FYE0_9GAMM|nr:hypothetical protein [Stenotrophomonas pennii]MBD7955728.1 hypothetical protein [Stenotrophomonas pennii]
MNTFAYASLFACLLASTTASGQDIDAVTMLARTTPQQCHNAFNASSAASSCRNARMEVWDQTNCTIYVDCLRNDGKTTGNRRTVPLPQVSSLRNCDGLLC